jgi:phage gpG-like protein
VSGHLRDSIRHQMIGKNAVRIGTNRVYAAIHQLGGKTAPRVIRPVRKQALRTPFGLFKKVNHPGSNIPARPYLGLSRGNSDEILRMINEYLGG